jgi:hypothetical protein
MRILGRPSVSEITRVAFWFSVFFARRVIEEEARAIVDAALIDFAINLNIGKAIAIGCGNVLRRRRAAQRTPRRELAGKTENRAYSVGRFLNI